MASPTSGSIYEDGSYLGKNPTWHEEDSAWKATQIIKILDRNGIDPRRICEIGCGAGGIADELAAHYGSQAHLTGYEISPQAYQLCKPRERQNLHFVLGDAFDDNKEKFDVALLIDVIEHVEDYFSLMRRVRDKATFKIFHIPLDLSAQSVLRGTPLAKWRADVGHIHYFTKDTALAALRDVGFEILDYFYTGTSLDLPNRGWKSNMMKMPRRLLFNISQDIAVRMLGGFSILVLVK